MFLLPFYFACEAYRFYLVLSGSSNCGSDQCLISAQNFKNSVLKIFIYLFIYLFILDCAGFLLLKGFFSSCSKQGLLFIAVHGFLIAVASLVIEYGLWGLQASIVVPMDSVVELRGSRAWLNSCGAWAQLLHSMRDLPGPGNEPVSPALPSRFLISEPLGKPFASIFLKQEIKVLKYRQDSHILPFYHSWLWFVW